jgi:hypothetical protein
MMVMMMMMMMMMMMLMLMVLMMMMMMIMMMQVGKKNDIYVMWMGKSLQVAPEGMTICILSTLLEVRRRSTTHIDHDTNRCGGRDSPTPPPIPSAARPKEGGGGEGGQLRGQH